MSKTAHKLALAILIALAFSVPQARAATVLDQEYLVNNGVMAGVTNGSGFRRAETFTVGVAGTLSEVNVITPRGVGGLPFNSLNILSTASGVPTTTVVGTGSFVSDTSGVAIFDTTLPVSVGEVLAIEPLIISPATFLAWLANNPGTYAGGASFFVNPSAGVPNFAADGNADDFRTFVTTTAPPTVPLPAGLPLFATSLGALGLLGWRRKRRAILRPSFFGLLQSRQVSVHPHARFEGKSQ